MSIAAWLRGLRRQRRRIPGRSVAGREADLAICTGGKCPNPGEIGRTSIPYDRPPGDVFLSLFPPILTLIPTEEQRQRTGVNALLAADIHIAACPVLYGAQSLESLAHPGFSEDRALLRHGRRSLTFVFSLPGNSKFSSRRAFGRLGQRRKPFGFSRPVGRIS